MPSSDLLWSQFRRLLLGTVAEAMLEEHVPVDFRSIRIHFDDASAFRVPRLDNYMRFKGWLEAELVAPFDRVGELARRLDRAWPELCAVLDLPVGDDLSPTQSHMRVRVEGPRLQIAFDLEAD